MKGLIHVNTNRLWPRSTAVACAAALAAAALSFTTSPVRAGTADSALDEPVRFNLTVEASAEGRKFSPRRLGGTNVAIWNSPKHFSDPVIRQWMTDLRTGYVRLPGGSWSNAVYWNGNGVRGDDGKIDYTKIGPDGYPAVDYSDYKPGFLASQGNPVTPSKRFNGNVDVKSVQDWIVSLNGPELMPCLNAGLGRPIDAAEWVRFNNFTHPQYKSQMWEIGNELDGSWEPGHKLADGSNITPDIYVDRYNAIASAAKAVDPNIKIGGLAFAKEMIERCGTNVDFVSIHTYPGTTSLTPQENLAAVTRTVEREVSKIRGWIREYQPQRESQIEIGYTEWNLSGGLNASDLFSGLWHARMLAEMARNGVDYATQWDTFTHSRGMTSGHGLIWTDSGDRFVRKAGYYAMWMWNNFTGDRVLAEQLNSVTEGATLYTLTTRDDGAVYLQFVNPDDRREARVSIRLNGVDLAEKGESVALTGREYFWDDRASVPLWSTLPRVTEIATGQTFETSVPPFSVVHVRVPLKGKKASGVVNEPAVDVAGKTAELKLMLPDSIYVGDTVRGYVRAAVPGSGEPFPVAVDAATLAANRPATFDRRAARLAEAIGPFSVVVAEPGPLTVTASNGASSVSKTIEVKPSVPRPIVFWDFMDKPVTDEKQFRSEFKLVADASLRANKEVARIDLPAEGVVPSEKKRQRALLIVNGLPPKEKLDRSNIRGVVFDMMTRDLVTEDPDARVTVVMQSPANYWMVLGSVPLADAAKWKNYQVDIKEPKHIDAVGSAYNVWLVLSSSKPIRGSICFDKIGLMVR